MSLGLWFKGLKVNWSLPHVGSKSADDSIVGFLDGGDRSTALPVSIMPAPPAAERESPPENTATAIHPKGPKSFVVSIAVTSTLLIKNLPSLLFSQPPELEPLLLPFGHIKKLDILEASGSDTAGFITVAVEYATADSAYEAKMTLDGQVYVNDILKIEFVQPVPSACDVLVHQNPQFPLVDGFSPLQAPLRSPLVNARYRYNARSTGMNTPTDGFFGAGVAVPGPASCSAPTTPYPFAVGSGTSYFASNTPLFDGRLDNARPLTRFAEV